MTIVLKFLFDTYKRIYNKCLLLNKVNPFISIIGCFPFCLSISWSASGSLTLYSYIQLAKNVIKMGSNSYSSHQVWSLVATWEWLISFNKKDDFTGNFKSVSKWLHTYCHRLLLRTLVQNVTDVQLLQFCCMHRSPPELTFGSPPFSSTSGGSTLGLLDGGASTL